MAKPSVTKTCGCCGETKPREQFHQEPYTTRWGKDSVRYIGTCQSCIDLGQFKARKIEKQCIFCKETKPASEFFSHKYTTKTGKISVRFMSGCKECNTDNRREWRHNNRSECREQRRRYAERHRDEIAERRKQYKAANREKLLEGQRRATIRSKFGLTPEAFQEMVLTQNGTCAICNQIPKLVKNRRYAFVVDHCHQTKKIRGLLCHQCNVSLGLMKEDPVRIQAMLGYILKHQS